MKKITKKLSFVTMVFLMFNIICLNHLSADEKIVYGKFSGKIIAETQDSKRIIMLESNDGTRMEFDIVTSTYIDNLAKIEEDSSVTCFYNKNEQKSSYYTAIAVVDDSTMTAAFLGKFDANLLDDTNELKLNIDDKVEIITRDGKKYSGDIKNKTLLAFYTIMTLSLPAQTTPSKIVVMEDSSNTVENTAKSSYEKFSGKIVEVTKNGLNRRITVQSNSKEKRTFEINSSTYIDTNVKISKNANVICFYDKSKVSSSKYTAIAIVNVSKDTAVFLGKFNNNLVDETNVLKLINTNKSNIISKTGKKYTGSLKNKVLLVFYTISTRSIPAQTTPFKIVVI